MPRATLTQSQLRRWQFVVPGIPPGPNIHVHWRKRLRLTKPLADALTYQVQAARPSVPLKRAMVTMTIRKMGTPYDGDNAVSCCKALQDALVRGGLLEDDGPAFVTLSVLQERARGREVVIVVEEMQ